MHAQVLCAGLLCLPRRRVLAPPRPLPALFTSLARHAVTVPSTTRLDLSLSVFRCRLRFSSLYIIDLLLPRKFGCASVIVCLGLVDLDLSNGVNLKDVTVAEVAWAKVLWRLSLAHWKPLRQHRIEVEGIRMRCGSIYCYLLI